MEAIELFGTILQVFPLVEGQINVTTTDGEDSDGIFVGAKAIDCRSSTGSITVTFSTGETDDISFVEGDRYGFPQAIRLEITAGTFHIA